MGLSLPSLKKIASVLGGVERQINPFDNGATYSKPNVAPGPSVISQITHPVNRLVNNVEHPSQLYRPVINSVNSSPLANYGRIAAADLTHNDLARTNASLKLKQSLADLNKRLQSPSYIASAAAGMTHGTPRIPKPKVSLTSQEAKMGRALGMSKKAVIAAKTENALPKVVKTAVSKMSPEDLASLKPGEQMAVHQLSGAGPPAKAPPAENAFKNPYKPNVRVVSPGDYGGARLAGQQLSAPIKTVAGRFEVAMNKLEKKSPGDWANFWRHIENPPKNPSKELEQAMYWWREGANRGHGSAVALGANTNYLQDFAIHPWKLADTPEEMISSGGPGILGKHAQNRKYRTISEGEQAGLMLGKDPTAEGMNYLHGSANAINRLAAKKALAEADAQALEKPRTLDLGHGHNVQLSEEGFRQAKALEFHLPSANKAVRAARTGNAALKTTILSGGQFHPVNIAAIRAGPAIGLKGHPVAAVKGVARTFRPLLPGGKGASDRVITQAYKDGMIDKAAELGMPYGQTGYNVAGTKLKSGVGHKMVFERQMPMMHDQVVRSIVKDLGKKNIPLGSPEARQAGIVGNATMGFINKEALNISPRVRQGMSDLMLAGQFTPSKVVTVGKAFKGGVAGNYARADVAANTMAAAAIAIGVGYLVKQQSDSARDIALRALVNPAVPTPYKDKKGNTQELRTPMTYTAEIAKILGISLERQPDGHLGVKWQPDKSLKPDSGLMDWLRSRLSPGVGSAVKIATNRNFASKPLYDPNAPVGTKAIQSATTLGQGFLPIGTQGIAATDAVKKHLPGSAQQVLEAGTPGSNPVLKSGLSSVGFAPRTDRTVGKAKDTGAYFDSVDKFSKGLDRQSKDAYDLWTGSKKNPVTGKYDVKPGYNDARAKASALLDNPKAFDALYNMNQNLASKGQKVDPLWSESKDNIRRYMQYQNMEPGGASRSDWYDKNSSWYQPLSDARGKFFTSLPPGDPNKPKLDLQYPEAAKPVQDLMDQYSNIEDSKQKGAFLDAHPEVIKQWNAQAKYTNEVRKKLGYSPLKNYPEPTDKLQSFMDQYNASDKATRKGLRSANPGQYQEMIAYFDSVDLYNIGKQASKSQLQGQPDYTSKEAKAISSLAKDIYKNPDGTYSIVPAGWMQGLSNDSSGGGYGYGYGSKKNPYYTPDPYKYAVGRTSGGQAAKPKVSVRGPQIAKSRPRTAAKLKVSLKKSLV